MNQNKHHRDQSHDGVNAGAQVNDILRINSDGLATPVRSIERSSKTESIHHSYWIRNRPMLQRFPVLDEEIRTDVLVMGGGITGLSVALRLLQDGLRVVICEANLVGLGTTTGSTGHLDAHPEYTASAWLKKLGPERARDLTDLRLRAIDLIESRCDEACGFKRIPAYYYTENSGHAQSIAKEADAATKCGLTAEVSFEVPIAKSYCGYRIERMARFDCAAYHERLLQLVVEAGGKIYEHTLVSGPTSQTEKSLSAGKGKVHFDQVVCATHANHVAALRLDAQLIPTQSYVLAARVRQPMEDALFWDDCNPYHYVRRIGDDGHEVLIGGNDHRTGTGEPIRSRASLELWARERFEIETILGQWSAEFFDPVDELPFIGRVPDSDRVWIATGLSGIGLTLGTAAGELIGDLICGKSVAVAESLLPARFKLSTAASAVVNQLPAAADYLERVLPSNDVNPTQLKTGEGIVGSHNGKHVAVCRDQAGCLHELSPICTHMGGVVHWNEAEQTWDCPVHGGRFAANGKRLYGPPEDDLSPIEPSDK